MLGDIRQPTLVIGNGEDIVHPLAFARELAELIPGARLEVIPSKTVDPTGYTSAFRAAIGGVPDGGDAMTPRSILVIDIGGTNAKFAAIRNGQHLPDTRQVPTPTLRAGGDPVDNLARLIRTIGSELIGEPDAVVATIPGFLDPNRDLVRFAGNIPELNGRRVASELQSKVGMPVTLERDAIMALRGEHRAGAGSGVRNLLGLFFGTGVGGAFLQDGVPFRGGGFALEIGSMPFKGELAGAELMPPFFKRLGTLEVAAVRTGDAGGLCVRAPLRRARFGGLSPGSAMAHPGPLARRAARRPGSDGARRGW